LIYGPRYGSDAFATRIAPSTSAAGRETAHD
jgi:hypothetical protein